MSKEKRTMDEQFREAMDECYNWEHEQKKRSWRMFNLVHNKLKACSWDIKHYLEDLEEDGRWRSVGIVDSTKGYEMQKEDSFTREDRAFKIWLWQVTGHLGDNYNGEILFPLKNGTFWRISYEM